MKKILKFLRNLLWTILMLAILSIAVIEVLVFFDVIELPSKEELTEWIGKLKTKFDQGVEDNEEYTVEEIDAKEYFSSNGEILSEINVSDAENIDTEADAYAALKDRGFTEYAVTTEYSMDGDYTEAADIKEDSEEKHPTYTTYYQSSAGEVWTISSIDGQITANPVSYNLQSELEVPVLISNSETLISYDSVTNQFYETIPSETVIKLVVVDRVDAETLDNMTVGEIDQYVNK